MRDLFQLLIHAPYHFVNARVVIFHTFLPRVCTEFVMFSIIIYYVLYWLMLFFSCFPAVDSLYGGASKYKRNSTLTVKNNGYTLRQISSTQSVPVTFVRQYINSKTVIKGFLIAWFVNVTSIIYCACPLWCSYSMILTGFLTHKFQLTRSLFRPLFTH